MTREGFGHVVFVVHDDAVEVKNVECFVGSPSSVFLTLIGICTAYAQATGRRVYPWRFTNPRLQRLYERRWLRSGADDGAEGGAFGPELDPLEWVDAEARESELDAPSTQSQTADIRGDGTDVKHLGDFERAALAFVLNSRRRK